MERYFGYALDAAGTLEIAPNCTVAVYNAGTLTLATIYADELPTPKANPFTPDATGYFFFYAAAGRYDVRFSGVGISVAFTWSDLQLIDSFRLARTDIGNTFTGNQTINGGLSVGGSVTVVGREIIDLNGKIPALTSYYIDDLNGSQITNLNASYIGSGTLGSSRLVGTYSQALTFSNVANLLAGASLSLGATPSTIGALRLTYNEGIYSKNSSAVDTLLLKLGASDKLELSSAITQHLTPYVDDVCNFGDTSLRYRNGHIKDLYTSILAFGYSLMATDGVIRLGNDSAYAIGFRNASDSDNKLFYLNASDQFVLGSATRINGNLLPNSDDALDLGSTSLSWRNLELSGTANLGLLKVGNGIQLQLAGGAFAEMIDMNGSNQLVLGHASYDIQFARPIAVPNSGAATLGVLPAGASTFHGWLKFITSTGTTVYVPCFK